MDLGESTVGWGCGQSRAGYAAYACYAELRYVILLWFCFMLFLLLSDQGILTPSFEKLRIELLYVYLYRFYSLISLRI